MVHTDPLSQLNSLPEPSVDALVDRHDLDIDHHSEVQTNSIQIEIAAALDQIESGTFERESQKLAVVNHLLRAMAMVDKQNNKKTFIQTSVIEDELDAPYISDDDVDLVGRTKISVSTRQWDSEGSTST